VLHLYGEVHPDHGGVNRDQSLDGQRQYQAVHVRQSNPDASRKRHPENIPTNRFYRRIVDIANRLVDPQPESAQSAQIEDPNREVSVVEIESQGLCKALDALIEQSSCLARASHEANDPCDQGAEGRTSQKCGGDVSPCAYGANSDQGHVRAAKVSASLHVFYSMRLPPAHEVQKKRSATSSQFSVAASSESDNRDQGNASVDHKQVSNSLLKAPYTG
jgi:hypothetical protein